MTLIIEFTGEWTLSVFASNLTVTRFDDPVPDSCLPTDCSLREAILDTNTDPNDNEIVLPPGSYTLTISAPLEITGSLMIRGLSFTDTVITGNWSTPVFLIHNGDVVLSNMTVNGGYGSGIQQQGGSLTIEASLVQWSYASTPGGGIHSQGDLTVINSMIANNGSSNNGGGIYAEGELLIMGSIISGNVAGNGGGIYATNHLVITGTTISNNWANAYDSLTQGDGGGIYSANGATAAVTDVVFASNHSTYDGAGILNRGILSVANTTFSRNDSGNNGGGIYNNTGQIFVTTSTFLSNTAGNSGGGIVSGRLEGGIAIIDRSVFLGNTRGAISTLNTLTVTNSTISGSTVWGGILNNGPTAVTNLNNVTIVYNSGYGVYLYTSGLGKGTINSRNSILAGNVPADCYDSLNSQGYNLIQSPGACVINGDVTGNIIGTSPNLGPLQDNGGATMTYALLAPSLAIDAANPTACESTDQRGFVRPVDGDANGIAVCDIGAFEFASPGPPTPTTTYWIYFPFIAR